MIYKIHTSRLRKSDWNLFLPIDEARRNDELIALADSQVMRWIDELNSNTDADRRAFAVRDKIRMIRKSKDSPANRKKIRNLYDELDSIQFRPDYMCLVIDKKSDYTKAVKGFRINGIRYKRLLGTPGGIKNSTIVFISESVYDEVTRRIENDRDQTKPVVAAKLEAYKGLVCSSSIPVSFPHGVLVVDDVMTTFKSDVVYLTDEGDEPEPVMIEMKDYNVELDASDGCGIMSPSLAERWSEELNLGYQMAGCCVRNAFTKGMVFTFDFHEFAEDIAKTYTVRDAWGDEVDIRNVELVLTTSMLKLWDSYASCDDYFMATIKNGYRFGVTKTCPRVLEHSRDLNYQFIQGYSLSDEDIEELVAPTIAEIQTILSGDWASTVLYMQGIGLNESNVPYLKDDMGKALMVDNRMINDPFIQQAIYGMIKNRIKEAKTGVLKVHGNYSICSGDPYALCQHIFGLEVTGLLKAGELYNHYWVGTPEVVGFRAPMTAHASVVKLRVADNKEVEHWYQYMNTCTIFNAWDTSMQRLNGMDSSESPILSDRKIG